MKNRVIKFRVWDGEKMYTFDNHAYDLIYNDICGWGVAPNVPNYKGPWLAGDSSDKHDESVMMQFTGLKDKHGKMIYEGDILNWDFCGSVQWSEWMAKPIYKVQYYNGYLPAAVGIYKELFLHAYRFQYTEVLGNIYENPELCQ